MVWPRYDLISVAVPRPSQATVTRHSAPKAGWPRLGAPIKVDWERLYRIVDVMLAIAAGRGVTPAQIESSTSIRQSFRRSRPSPTPGVAQAVQFASIIV